jgi:NAD(P)-dependent dehydrogenase (short-subunit alcohol dehydrogenase family)
MTHDASEVVPGEVAVVVGATGAVGSEVVRRLAERGLAVVAVGRREGALRALADEVPGVEVVAVDVATDEAVVRIREGVGDRPVRMALLCAGLPVRGSVVSIDPSLLAVGTEVKIGGAVRLFQAVRDRLGSHARFVAVAGTLGIEPGSSEAGPGAVNAGLLNVMKQISRNTNAQGFTVHSLVPGPMDTPRLRAIATTIAEEEGVPFDEVWARYEGRTSLGRLPRVEEVAWAVELLLAPEADILHGSVLHLDAGGLRGVV